MGTRGTLGFRIDNEDKLTYNQFDSYLEGMGDAVVKFIHSVKDWDKVKEQVRALRNVSRNGKPTPEDIEACKEYTDLSVSDRSTEDWYCLLRDTQGNPEAILNCGLFEEQNTFIQDSLFCEFGYIINLDENTIEFYEGFQKSPHEFGRYSDFVPGKGVEYFACALIAEFPLNDIPEDWMEKVTEHMDTDD